MEARSGEPPVRGRALGVRVRAWEPVLALAPGGGDGTRELTLRGAERVPELPEPSERIAELPGAGGEPYLRIDRHPELGYRIEAAGHGAHLLSPDGRTATCAPSVGADWEWHRLFFAQVLPTAAALQGLEILHASAVALGDEATAVVSRSGGGKTTLAMELVSAGAAFVTDDVLAVERKGDGVLAHPGPGFAGIEQPGGAEKRHVDVDPVAEPVRLARLVFLERGGSPDRPELTRLSPPDPRLLLASTFAFHLTTRERLEAQLDTCAAIASRVACFRLSVPAGEPPSVSAGLLLRD
jgi:hypothetical protein